MIVVGIKHCPPRWLDITFPNHRLNPWFYKGNKMLIVCKINNFPGKVLVPLTHDATQHLTADTVVKVDWVLKEGTEDTTDCRSMWLQVFICGLCVVLGAWYYYEQPGKEYT